LDCPIRDFCFRIWDSRIRPIADNGTDCL